MNDTIYFAINKSRPHIKVSAGLLAEIILEREEDAFDAVASVLKDVATDATDRRSLCRVPRGGTHRKSRLYAVPASALTTDLDGESLRAVSVAMH